jgi:hypothetical protein
MWGVAGVAALILILVLASGAQARSKDKAAALPPQEGLQGKETAAPGDVITVYRTRHRENRPLNVLHSSPSVDGERRLPPDVHVRDIGCSE